MSLEFPIIFFLYFSVSTLKTAGKLRFVHACLLLNRSKCEETGKNLARGNQVGGTFACLLFNIVTATIFSAHLLERKYVQGY